MKKKQYTQLRNAPSHNRDRSRSSNKDVSILLENHSQSKSNQRLAMNYGDESHDYLCEDQKENKQKNRSNSALSNSSKKRQSSSGHQMRKRSSNLSISKQEDGAYGESQTPLDLTNHNENCSQAKLSRGSSVGRQTADCEMKIQNSALGQQQPMISASAGEIKKKDGEKKSIGNLIVKNKSTSLKRMATNQQQPMNYTKVFVMGDTRYGQLGFQCTSDSNSKQALSLIEVPRTCSYNILVKAIACGEAHTHLLSQDGYVYSMGQNSHGVLGLGRDQDGLKSVTQPQLVSNLQCVIQIASGRVHTVVLDVKRDIFAWGRCDNGAIGLQQTNSVSANQPNLVTINLNHSDRVDQVDCGLEHSCFLTVDGHVFACGEGEYGQLGLGHNVINQHRPMKVQFNDMVSGDYVTQVACGAHHTAYLTRRNQVFTSGLNNLGQLGIESQEPQVNRPMLVESLGDLQISEISTGESTFAITNEGELYVWGLYNLQVCRFPTLVTEIEKPVSSVSQSFYGVTAAVDTDDQAWYWYACLDTKAQNLLNLKASPTVVKQLRKRQVRKVFAGKDLIFALGEDVATLSSITMKESTLGSGSGLQEIPERDERRSSGTTNTATLKKMPALNLAKLHKTSQQSLSDVNEVMPARVTQNIFNHMPLESTQKTKKKKTPSRSHSGAKSHKKTRSEMIRQSLNRPVERRRTTEVRSESTGSKERHNATRQLQQSHQLTKKQKSRSSNHLRSHSTHVKTEATAKTQIPANSTQDQQRNISLHSITAKSQKSQNAVKKRTNKFERQVSLKFKDLGKRLESDKEELFSRLTKLTRKVARIQKAKPLLLVQKKLKTGKQQQRTFADDCEDKVSDLMSAGFMFTSENNINKVKQDSGQTSDNEVAGRQQMNMFNQELVQDMTTQNKPQLVYSPGGQGESTVVDIRSPTALMGGEGEKKNMDVSESQRLLLHQDHDEQLHRRNQSQNNQDILQEAPLPGGYINVRSQNCRSIRSPSAGVVVQQSDGFKSPPNKHEQALISQLREQIAFLEQQNCRLQEEQKLEQAKVQDYSNRYDDARNQVHQTEMTSEGQVRSLESQLRTNKIEKQDMTIKLLHADRRTRVVEAQAIELDAAKRKEDDYVETLGKSHETLRIERERNDNLQNQNEKLQQTLTSLETTIAQVKIDKEVIERECSRLKEFLEAKDIEIDKQLDYIRMIEFTRNELIKEQGLDRKSKSLGMHSSSKAQLSKNTSPDCESRDTAMKPLRQKRFRRDASLAEKSIGRSSRRLASQLSQPPLDCDSSNLISLYPTTRHGSVVGVEPGSELQKHKDQKHTQRSALVLSKEKTSSDPLEKDSKDTGRFVGEDRNEDRQSDEEPRDPRIQRLLQESEVLQEKHSRLMSQSPLRLKQASPKRLGISSNQQQSCFCHCRNDVSQAHSVKETTDFAKSINYARTTENPQPSPSPQPSPAKINRHDGGRNPVVQYREPSPMNHRLSKSKSPISVLRPLNHSPLRSNSRASPVRFSVGETLMAHPYQEGIIQEIVGDDNTIVREDFNPNQIRESAGINIYKSQAPVEPRKRRDSALRDKTRSKERDRSRHWAEEPPRSDMDNPSPGYTSQNRDYINKTKDREILNKRPDSSLGPIDREKLQEAYNQKLLNQVESLAAQAHRRNDPPRLNKFMRSQDNAPSTHKDNNTSLHTISDRGISPNQGSRKSNMSQPRALPQQQQQQQQPLPKTIFGGNSNNGTVANRSASKSGRRQPRAQSKEDDHDETMQMLVEPRRGTQWTYGMDQGRRNSNEKVIQTADNNSFLARRAALQSRLKNL